MQDTFFLLTHIYNISWQVKNRKYLCRIDSDSYQECIGSDLKPNVNTYFYLFPVAHLFSQQCKIVFYRQATAITV